MNEYQDRFKNKGFTDDELNFLVDVPCSRELENEETLFWVTRCYNMEFSTFLCTREFLARYEDYQNVLHQKDVPQKKTQIQRNAEDFTKELIGIFIKTQKPEVTPIAKDIIFNWIWEWEKWSTEKFEKILQDIQNEDPSEKLSSDLEDTDDANDGLDPMDGFQKDKELHGAEYIADFQKMAEDLFGMIGIFSDESGSIK